MNITIFGGTGTTGLILIEKALKEGYSVTAFARNPSKITIQHNNLKIIKGELTDLPKIEEAIQTADAVISLLGPIQGSKGFAISDGIKNIIKVMEKQNCKRLIATATPSFKDGNDKFQFGFALAVFSVKMFMKDVYNDINLIGRNISESSLDWTIVRLPMLSDKPDGGKINVGYIGDGSINLFSLSRIDLAFFLLQQVKDRKWLHKAPVLSN